MRADLTPGKVVYYVCVCVFGRARQLPRQLSSDFTCFDSFVIYIILFRVQIVLG